MKWRALVVAMIGAAAVVGVLLSQKEGIQGQPASPDAAGDLLRTLPSVLATLDGHPISRHEVAEEIAGMPDLTMDDVRAAVQKLIEVRLVVDGSAMIGHGQSSTVTGEDQLARQAVVWPEEIETFWSRHRETFAGDFFNVSRIARGAEQDARATRQAFLATATENPAHTVTTAAEWLGPGQLDAVLERVLSRMKPGEISEPVLAAGHDYVLQLLDRKPASQVALADWAPRLAEHLRAERWHRDRTRWLRIREAYAAMTVAPELNLRRSAMGLEQFKARPDLVAVVNGQAITEKELAAQVAQVRAMSKKPSVSRPLHEHDLRPVLGRMIQNSLVMEEARKLGLQVTDFELEQRFQALRSGFSSDEAFETMLHANATSRADWWRNMREGLLLLKTEYAQTERLPVDPLEIEAYWKQNRAALAKDRLKMLRVPFRTEQEAQEALAQVQSGTPVESFTKVSHADYQQTPDSAQWFTHDMLVHEIWMTAWHATLQTVVGPVRSPDGYWLLRVEDRQEAKAQTVSNHREHIMRILQRTHWLERERTRWLLSLIERATVWNRFDLTLKLHQKAPPIPGLQIGKRPTLVVMTLDQACYVAKCDSLEKEWNHTTRLQIVPPSEAERAVRIWGLPTAPWTFAIDERGIVVGEYPGPVTKTVLEQLAALLEQKLHRPLHSAHMPDIVELAYAR